MEYVILNGRLIEKTKACLSVENRAFHYGDGLFESMRCKGKHICFPDLHFERLLAGMEALQIQAPERFISTLENNTHLLLNTNKTFAETRVKIMVWRKSGGLYTPADNHAEYIIFSSEFHQAPEVKDLVLIYKDWKLVQTKFSSYKTCNALPYIMAATESKILGAHDMILTDYEDNIAECISSNIYWITGQNVFIPSLETGCINGVIRRKMMETLPGNGFTLQEGKFGIHSLDTADVVFTTNISGLSFLRTIEGKQFEVQSPLAKTIQDIVESIYIN